VTVDATSSEKVLSISVGASVGGDVAVAVNAGISVYDITTQSYIDGGPLLSDGAIINADGNARVAADEKLKMDVIAGNLAASGTAAVGGAAAVPIVTKHTNLLSAITQPSTPRGALSGLLIHSGDLAVSVIDTRFAPGDVLLGDNTTLDLAMTTACPKEASWCTTTAAAIISADSQAGRPMRFTSSIAMPFSSRTWPLSRSPLLRMAAAIKSPASDGDWVTDGFAAGQQITLSGTQGNNSTYTIDHITPNHKTIVLTVANTIKAGSATTVTLSPGHYRPVTAGQWRRGPANRVGQSSGRATGQYAALQSADARGANTITLPYSLSLSNDSPVVYSSGGGQAIGGLTDGATYYVTNSGGGFKLSATKADRSSLSISLWRPASRTASSSRATSRRAMRPKSACTRSPPHHRGLPRHCRHGDQ